MKKLFPFIIGGVLLMLLVVLLASRYKPQRRLDERITLRQRDKIPYGMAVAKSLLPSLFPQAAVINDNRYPGSWDNIDPEQPRQAVILVADYLNASQEELDYLDDFVEHGNDVFIIARSFSDDASHFFGVTVESDYSFMASDEDSLLVHLQPASFSSKEPYTYPGKRYEGRVHHHDPVRAAALGTTDMGQANFLMMKKGKGRFFVHTSPLAFSNYFLLYKKNIGYYQQAFSAIPANVTAVVWNEYYLDKQRNPSDQKSPNWLATLLKYPAFKWGLLTASAFLLLYCVLGMRRRQRVIRPHQKPTNDALDFVKTLGRLYYDKGDHHNLAMKMGAYFLEHVRSTYKMPTHTLDADFVHLLHRKSGYPEAGLNNILSEIKEFQEWSAISEERLAQFYRQLEQFYQTT